MGEKGKPALEVIDYASSLFFKAMQLIVKLAPIGAFGAMAYAVGEHGLQALVRLAALMAGFYLTAIVFVIVVLEQSLGDAESPSPILVVHSR